MKWKKYMFDEKIESNLSHTIGRCKSLKHLKQVFCNRDINTNERKRGLYTDKRVVPITVEDDDNLTAIDGCPTFKIGESYFSRYLIYRLLEELFDMKVMLSNNKRPYKRQIGKIYNISVCKPFSKDYPLLVCGDDYFYVVAPYLSGDE